MRTIIRRALALALLVVGVASMTALALPGFSDMTKSAGNLNPTDRILVQQIKVTGDSAYATTITSVTVQNLGSAASGEVEKIELWEGGVELGSTTNMSGLASGVVVNLTTPCNVPKSAIRYINVFVTVGSTVSGGETVALRVKSHYVRDESSYSSAWISDLSIETIRKGGFDQITDSPPDAGYLNPTDDAVVQTSVFKDSDANGNDILWVQTGSKTIVTVENLGTATTADIAEVSVTLTVNGVDYTTWDTDKWLVWNPASPMDFDWDEFDNLAVVGFQRPPNIPNNSSVTVKVEMKLGVFGAVTDGRTIRTKATLLVKEGAVGSEVSYEQSMTSGTTQTIRKQGFESINDESTTVASGTKATGESLEQIVRVSDSDINTKNIRILEIKIQNLGTATGAEIHRIRATIGGTTIFDLKRPGDAAAINNLKTGHTEVLPDPGLAAQLVADNGNAAIKIYYEIGTPVDGHTLRPTVQVRAREADAGATLYWSDEATYPDSIELFQPGFETVENMTPPEGGTVYSGQRVLVQKIHVVDRDENTDNVTIHPIVVKNVGTAQGNPDVTKIQVYLRNTEGGEELLLGETTDLAGFRTAGARIDILQDNTVIDTSPYAEAFLYVYLTIAEPGVMVAGRTIQLETRVLHTETLVGYDKMVTSNQWTLATNHRPVPSFTFAVVTAGTASIGPKADYSTTDTIQFTGAATDSDGDAIASWDWDFDDGNTADVQNPTHRYATGGTFTVTLTVTDARGVTGTVSKTIEIEGPPNVVPVIDAINADPENPAEDQAVAFSADITDPDQPTGTAFTYAWDFGDSTTSASAAPSHPFADKQSYTVTLTVTDAQGGTATATATISVGNEKPLANFTASTTTPSTGDEVQFTDTSTDPDADDTIAEWSWAFGDGAVSIDENPTHTYTTAGTRTVTLIVTDSRGAVSEAKTAIVTVAGPAQIVFYGFPNPAATRATITYFLPEGAADPELWIFDLNRNQILQQALAVGETEFEWNLQTEGGTAISNGLYFCMIVAKNDAGRAITSDIFRLLVAR